MRAERRFKELAAKEKSAPAFTKEQVLQQLAERDERDSTRAFAPLTRPTNAKEIDTSDLDIDQVVTIILEYVGEQKKKTHEPV